MHFILGLLAFWPREASRLEAVLHEAEAVTHEDEAEAKTHEAEAEVRCFGLEAEARPRGLTSLPTGMAPTTYTFYVLDPHYKAVLL